VRDNLMLASKHGPIAVDARGLTWQADMAKPGGALMKGLEAVPYRDAVWASRYPDLARLPDDRPGAPVGNRFLDNLADRALPHGEKIEYLPPPRLGHRIKRIRCRRRPRHEQYYIPIWEYVKVLFEWHSQSWLCSYELQSWLQEIDLGGNARSRDAWAACRRAGIRCRRGLTFWSVAA